MPVTTTSIEATLEATFSDAESSLSSAADDLTMALKAVRNAQKAAQLGDVQALSRGVNTARSALGDVEPALDRAGDALRFDYPQCMRSGQFAQEVTRLAASKGLAGVRVVYGVIFSFPVILTPLPDKLGVRVGKKLMRVLRPSALVATLEAARKQKPSPARLGRLLNAIERTYANVAPAGNVAVKIETIYDRLTPLPEQKDDYSEADFIVDLYALERANILVSSSGRVLSFPASTSTRGGKAVRITTEEGEERLYSSLRFD